ncbi:hypothetical protein OJAV_G00163680 [Oryzias javanicus]|uniref:Uncharacterized protein n=1 Tax=Oryzias javanicus TaxID=123683 RepID=A0A437CL15_ORYJA|nr:hypothetical protein OJAV_G00163680 [Oryzias javanicus]
MSDESQSDSTGLGRMLSLSSGKDAAQKQAWGKLMRRFDQLAPHIFIHYTLLSLLLSSSCFRVESSTEYSGRGLQTLFEGEPQRGNFLRGGHGLVELWVE